MTIEERARAGITVEELRAKYPEPIKGAPTAVAGSAYCVGGALCLELCAPDFEGSASYWTWFPTRVHLAHVMRKVRPELRAQDALVIAGHITKESDAGNFEDAWSWLAKGLES